MDFPEVLESCQFVDDAVQMKQSVKVLLQNMVGSFAQDAGLGALFDIHTYDFAVIHSAIYQTLSVLPIEVTSVNIYPPSSNDEDSVCRVSVVYVYNNAINSYKNFD